ncbi:hypothetical protein LY90DRAFT_501524 [Neocallimastix californiae]|uniref:Uncharacterized protein n=1 Tax=Neocallimastix californiae TaxID=1754190 RepID=A0A1Y2EZU9_9FUNG|nr:hypothetical protein LY90DRAFT_501524 [Neocallimastix californiae]|eukprot:ORY77138.1 hypothetical protein LY90DRAFT_501524 [Neocallimastix californiae]
MKCLLLSILSIFCNVLIINGQYNYGIGLSEDNPKNSDTDVTQNISYNSILDDINNFYNQNMKYQVVANAESNTADDSNTTEKTNANVIGSNFTIVWSYNNILEGYEYNYPKNDVTIKLFFEEDANPNNWSNAWKNPVFEKTIPLEKVETGPILNGIQTYQYNWFINPKDGFIRSPKSNEKYKLRIYGDGKDVQSNSANFQCYGDGDIQPGLTVAFYIVENNRIEERYYRQLPIVDNGDGMQAKSSLVMSLIAAIFLILFNLW